MKKNLFLNFSERPNGKTRDITSSLSNKLGGDPIYMPDFKTCINCELHKCTLEPTACIFTNTDTLEIYRKMILEYKNIYFCFPVYLNMPTPKLMSFLSRLASMNDNESRMMFKNQNAYIVSIGDVSGTQKASSDVMIALNMLGFNLPPRCVYEHINNWQDNKIRGGNALQKFYIENKEGFKTRSES